MSARPVSKICICLLLIIQFNGALLPRQVEFPLLQSMSYFPYSENHILKRGELSLTIDFYYSNIYMFNHHRTIINDFELFSNSLGLRYGLAPGWNLEIYFRWSVIFPGILDKAIEGFHDLFKIPDTNRAEFPAFAVLYKYKDYLLYEAKKSSSSPLIMAVLREIHKAKNMSLNGRVLLGLPVQKTPGFSSNKPFFGSGIIFLYKKNKFNLELANYITLTSKPSWIKDEVLRKTFFFSNLELGLARFIGGFIYRSSIFREDDIAHHTFQGYIGYKISQNIEFIILEDFAPFDTSPDISFNLRIKLF
jgi:hypothetical protein